MKNLTACARQYNESRGLRSRTLVYNVSRFASEVTNSAEAVTPESFDKYRRKSVGTLSAWTIEKTITDVQTVLSSIGISIQSGRRIKRPRPSPDPAAIADISSTWQAASGWVRQWIVLSYWTGLRLGDAINMQCQLDGEPRDVLRWKASKTGHDHMWPFPEWLRPHLYPMSLPYSRNNDHARAILRVAIRQACKDAKVPEWLPNNLRDRSLNEWTRANGAAGAVIHGKGLGVLDHYIVPIELLTCAAMRLRIPDGWRSEPKDKAENLILVFRQLDDDAQSIILRTAERMTGGA